MAQENDKFLSQYIDIINQHGRESPEAKQFYQAHKADADLKKLMDGARELQVMFERGELK